MSEKYHLTPVELELMEILWKINQGSVHDVLHHLPEERPLAYTSVSTILRILQQKNIVGIKKLSRQHIYYPLLDKEIYAKHSIKKIVQQVFSGKSVDLVAYLVDKNRLSLDEIQHLQKLLNSKKKELAE
ncbi:MAG TPA: BlaI/MecI/CopY family transcriptional regulator [Gammaproteobacteria bacterium]|nr:BlaI/MecI/CopY family transcriptional regulator [Gammaproteobacteria bacterium]